MNYVAERACSLRIAGGKPSQFCLAAAVIIVIKIVNERNLKMLYRIKKTRNSVAHKTDGSISERILQLIKAHQSSISCEKSEICRETKGIYHEFGGMLGHRTMRVFLARKQIFLSKTTVHEYMNKELRLHCVCRRKRPGYKKGQA